MDVTPLIPAGRQIIQGYGDGGFRISGVRHEGSVLIFPAESQIWAADSVESITEASLTPVVATDPKVEILLIGTGPKMQVLPSALRQYFRNLGIAIDAMDTGAACRTYNVLLAEERRVAAALIAV